MKLTRFFRGIAMRGMTPDSKAMVTAPRFPSLFLEISDDELTLVNVAVNTTPDLAKENETGVCSSREMIHITGYEASTNSLKLSSHSFHQILRSLVSLPLRPDIYRVLNSANCCLSTLEICQIIAVLLIKTSLPPGTVDILKLILFYLSVAEVPRGVMAVFVKTALHPSFYRFSCLTSNSPLIIEGFSAEMSISAQPQESALAEDEYDYCDVVTLDEIPEVQLFIEFDLTRLQIEHESLKIPVETKQSDIITRHSLFQPNNMDQAPEIKFIESYFDYLSP